MNIRYPIYEGVYRILTYSPVPIIQSAQETWNDKESHS